MAKIPIGKTAIYRLFEKEPPQHVRVLSHGRDNMGAYTLIMLESGEEVKTHPSNLKAA